ncbi:ankyrin repeat protein, putative [Trichomonas vaginalis G3]|uniref:Ankyrin repeat protein, putative n=1 Tax=Trichomonas vaginalis (strain ATCC PRA-98 / G3) TaxID=412133 RepID=A2DMT8_TRIV3|nr:spectrin binding [Trichomonas vaginalis G3]EAY18309.1 ankyrin repeat protein, putative [Trichomonas vaginalis G3]KAI5541868.1 spectrin binding [Trichomonas vaginalis G3]|eukprot:XP_001579295.1 ankyrin repeat protein [Trichomonas vaginalis G3]
MKDDRSSLIVFIKDDDGFDTHQMMDSDYYPDGYLSLLELCCYHGAVDCFKIFRTKFNFKITKRCLELAFIGGNPDIMSECLKVNKPYKRCMKYAIASHNIDFVCYLMNEHNIDIDLKYCCKFNNLQAFLVYLDQTNNINDCFIYSPMFNMPSLCEYLISHGADVNTTNPKNQTTLHLAAKHSNKRVVEFLISHGANINAKDSNGRIALHSAITYPTFNLEIIEFLVLHGAEINAKENKYGYTPLHKSTSETMTDIAVFLIEHGADIKSTDIKGQTPLHHAVDYNNVELVKLLISKGAEIDAQDLNGETALHLAALNGNTKMVEILLINGANVNAKNVDGVTVLQKASVSYYTYYETNREEIDKTNVVEYLILYGAIINETDNSGDMALHYAAFSNNIEAIKLLLLYGAIVDAKDKDGWSAYKIADARRYNEIIEILTKNGSTEQPSTMNFNFNVFPQFGFF